MGSILSALTGTRKKQKDPTSNNRYPPGSIDVKVFEKVDEMLRKDPATIGWILTHLDQLYNGIRVEERYKKGQQLIRDIATLKDKYNTLREDLEVEEKKEDPKTDDLDLQNAFELQKELLENEEDIRKRIYVPFPVTIFPELDKQTSFMVSLLRDIPEEHRERYLLTVLEWSRTARKHKELA
ncbi:hypothetical protein P171DRAFT_484849 [Karstenula rhodostoma CBS 690.94]|uniref:Uncharacterized protein n=1 Tax=Karstenula rhodostoma CBS 690.94 TaxID=1392251 RepID=A0A9P4UD30_9PLEO|nr:hypothetical protein P171DRAFT_484849 [Karstenula rhodostoma CBS 690.94]